MHLMDRYYRGDHPLPFLTEAHRDKIVSEFRVLLDDSRSNFMRLVIEAVEERLQIDGFRLSGSSDEGADRESWDIWQASGMDEGAGQAMLESLIKGVSYLSVWGPTGQSQYPTIAVEDPCQTIVEYAPGTNHRVRLAALKMWRDDIVGRWRANVYLPSAIYKYQSSNRLLNDPATIEARRFTTPDVPVEQKWMPFLAEPVVPNPLGIVPIVPLRNNPRPSVEGSSEIADAYRMQNQVNGFLFLLALAGYFGAHRQRWVTGMRILKDGEGKDVEPFDTAIDRLWQSENPETKFGEFGQTALDGYLAAIEQKVLHIAVTTRTPRHYLIQQGQSPSGDAIKSAESGLVKKVEKRQRPFAEGLEEAMRLARQFMGRGDGEVDSEVVWRSPETESEGVRTDSVIKQYISGLISRRQALEVLGYSPQQIEKMLGEPVHQPVNSTGAAPGDTIGGTA